jgi:hypothetical protein
VTAQHKSSKQKAWDSWYYNAAEFSKRAVRKKKGERKIEMEEGS